MFSLSVKKAWSVLKLSEETPGGKLTEHHNGPEEVTLMAHEGRSGTERTEVSGQTSGRERLKTAKLQSSSMIQIENLTTLGNTYHY